MNLLPIVLLGGGAAALFYFSSKGKEKAPVGELSSYTLTSGEVITLPFNQLISMPGVGPATQAQLGEGLTIRWLGFATSPQDFTMENAMLLERDLALAGAWYEASYIQGAIPQLYG